MRSFEKPPESLNTDYLDLYLIHMPYGDYHSSWRAMEELYRSGKIKASGVCNFLPDRLADLILSHEIVPAVNQIELHPFCQQRALRQVMAQYGIVSMAWPPFAEGQNRIFTHPALTEIGKQYGKKAWWQFPNPFTLSASRRTFLWMILTLAACRVKPMVNQILLHISNTDLELLDYCKTQDIQVEAYSPIAHGETLKNPVIADMAKKYGVSAAQLCIRYVLELGAAALPKAANPKHMKANAAADFTIAPADMEILKYTAPTKNYGEFSFFPVFSGK